jgi:hypothetical protein
MSSSGTLHRQPYFKGGGQQPLCRFMQARRKLVSSLSGVAWTVRSLLLLSSCSAQKRAELTWTWSLASRETAREEVF